MRQPNWAVADANGSNQGPVGQPRVETAIGECIDLQEVIQSHCEGPGTTEVEEENSDSDGREHKE